MIHESNFDRLEGFGVEKWDSTKEPITKRRLNEIATQIAKGMNYLSSKKVRYLRLFIQYKHMPSLMLTII